MHLINSERYVRSLNNVCCDGLAGKTLVITGGTGMIGSCLVDALAVFNRKGTNPCRIVVTGRRLEAAQKRFGYCWSEPWFTFLQQDVCDETVAEVLENQNDFQGIDIAEQSLREYPDSKYFASIIGYTGVISQEEFDAKKKQLLGL